MTLRTRWYSGLTYVHGSQGGHVATLLEPDDLIALNMLRLVFAQNITNKHIMNERASNTFSHHCHRAARRRFQAEKCQTRLFAPRRIPKRAWSTPSKGDSWRPRSCPPWLFRDGRSPLSWHLKPAKCSCGMGCWWHETVVGASGTTDAAGQAQGPRLLLIIIILPSRVLGCKSVYYLFFSGGSIRQQALFVGP